MGMLRLHVSVVLRHILDKRFKLDDNEEEEEEEAVKGEENASASRLRRKRSLVEHDESDLLDFEGPKLVEGLHNWLFFYQLLGQLNWQGRPLYLSILYKLAVFSLSSYVVFNNYLLRFYRLRLISDSFRNPIFLFISFLALLTFSAQILVTLRVNLFHLAPLYKVLQTPRLCFIKEEALHLLGTSSLGVGLLVHVFNALISAMIVSENLEDFIAHFRLPRFLLEIYASAVFTYYLVGLTQVDLYVRSAFGHWLLALRSHLEHQFTRLHRAQQRALLGLSADQPAATGEDRPPLHLITLDEVQKNLNHMDDHLEVLRSIQTVSLVLMTLNAFLGNGSMFLLAYHLIADQTNYYHGCLFLLLAASYTSAIFLSYSGDRIVFYALNSLVQSVEDEYFMQRDGRRQQARPGGGGGGELGAAADELGGAEDEPDDNLQQEANRSRLLLIRKKDVLFCREFLHQFENHLATPWSKLTFKSHLHMLRTFVTLIAAQIIFDHEH